MCFSLFWYMQIIIEINLTQFHVIHLFIYFNAIYLFDSPLAFGKKKKLIGQKSKRGKNKRKTEAAHIPFFLLNARFMLEDAPSQL